MVTVPDAKLIALVVISTTAFASMVTSPIIISTSLPLTVTFAAATIVT